MSSSQIEIEELKIVEDISHNLALYKLEDLCTEEEIKEAVEVISELGQSYRHVHVELKSVLGETYEDKYKKYEDISSKLFLWTKSAKEKLRDKRNECQENKNSETTKNLKIECELLDHKVMQLNMSVDIFILNDDNEIDKYVHKIESWINDYFELCAKMKSVCPDEYREISEEIMNRIFEMQQDIKMAKLLKYKIQEVKSDRIRLQVFQNEQRKHLTNAENLIKEVKYRFKSLSKKFDLKLNDLGDYQILEIYQDKNLDQEFNGILEKVTALASLAPFGGEVVRRMGKNASKIREKLAEKREKFSASLQKIVIERDITPEKMKSMSGLTIELPKYSGYESKIDYFTFKSQFQKLIEPKVQKKYWPDYLKRNYLSGQAYTLVEKETDYNKIWTRLRESYGNSRLLLQNKLATLDKIGGLWKIRGDKKIGAAIASLINVMKDLSTLASEHGIEGQLYEGGGLEKIMTLIGDTRHRKFRNQNLDPVASKKEEWQKLRKFLEHELQLREKLTLDHKTAELMGLSSNRVSDSRGDSEKSDKMAKQLCTSHNSVTSDKSLCHICEQDGHTRITTSRGNEIIPYYVCETFVNMSAAERLSKLTSKNLCTGCLYPGAIKGAKHRCFFTNFCCPSHEREKIHILLCDQHKKDDKNVKLFEKFKDRFIKNSKTPLPHFSKSITLFSSMVGIAYPGDISLQSMGNHKGLPDIKECAIFQLQTINVDGLQVNLFFDSGCGDMIIKKATAEKLADLGKAKKIQSGPLEITGVGEKKTECEDGVYSVWLPLHNGENACLSGICLPKITCDFPSYELTNVEKDIRERCQRIGGNELMSRLPRLPLKVGGDTDILIGIKYSKYFPKLVHEFESGLCIYESPFRSPKGTRGVLGGPHKEFSRVENSSDVHISKVAYYSNFTYGYHSMWKLGNDMPLLTKKHNPTTFEEPICCEMANDLDLPNGSKTYCENSVCTAKRGPKRAKLFDNIENSGTEVTYRCVDCRSCDKCKNGPRTEAISIQEEIEQTLIERSVNVDIERGQTMAFLPFPMNPDTRLAPTEQEALKVFRSQVKKLNTKPEDKQAVLEFEQKLQDLGYVQYVSELSDNEKNLITNSDVRYFIPWRPVWSKDSVSTPCRLTFDASMGAKGGCSLNSLLPKGSNSLNNLQEITIRWTTHKHAYHTDVQKMYNKVLLHPSHWRYQLYLWSKNLNEGDIPEWKVIKTLIYGVRPSGNLAEFGLRQTAELCKDEFPLAYEPITHDTYMDDCMSGTENLKLTLRVTDQLQTAVGKGGFTLKGFTMSGSDPPEHLSSDLKSVSVAGLKWFPKKDILKFNISQLNFAKKERGRKQTEKAGIMPDVLTLRDCVSRTSEIFDPLGKIAPIVGGLKLDISVLHKRCVGWDDPIPNELKNIWAANFDLINEIGNIEFNRAVVPSDAVNLDIETIDTADASENLVCAAVYARFLRRDGSHSCQLIFARTKIIHDLSIPRAELVAAVLNASTGHIICASLKERHKRSWKVTDSQVVLNWINCTKAALKMWVRNRVVEVTRLTDRSRWYYTRSENMIADLGTRKGAKIEQVCPNSPWHQGLPWMRGEECEFPLLTINDIILTCKEKSEANKEKVLTEFESSKLERETCLHANYVPKEVEERYKFSRYIINPNKHRFRTVVKILALAFLFIKKLNDRCKKRKLKFLNVQEHIVQNNNKYVVFPVHAATKVAVVHLSQNMLDAAKSYYFRKAALEVQQFVEPSKYRDKSVWKENILYYTGRILPTQKIDGRFSLGDASLDLSEATFCVPVTDANSPIAYAIVSETHWFDPDVSHAGVESTLRYAQNTAYIIEGRALVKRIQKACTKCRILHKKGVKVAMGPIGAENLKVAPPFFFCQVDLCGPFNAYSPVNKRATLKVWIVVFCCTVTGAIDCRIMENYNTDSFVLAFVRFSCRFGYPKRLMPDEGSQLVSGCQNMILSFSDLKHKITTEYGVEFKTCPVGAHYVHGKVERKIQQIKKSLIKTLNKNRISVLQWETLGQQVSNSINNMPIGLGNKTELLEHIDVLTPNRLILGRNNSRNPTTPLEISGDFRRIIKSNSNIFQAWFQEWLISYVPSLVEKPKWFVSERNISVGDIVLFTKSEKEFDRQYQYGIISSTIVGRDGLIRSVEIQYQNNNEKTKRTTKRGVRDIVVIHPVDEIGILAELHEFAESVKNEHN